MASLDTCRRYINIKGEEGEVKHLTQHVSNSQSLKSVEDTVGRVGYLLAVMVYFFFRPGVRDAEFSCMIQFALLTTELHILRVF